MQEREWFESHAASAEGLYLVAPVSVGSGVQGALHSKCLGNGHYTQTGKRNRVDMCVTQQSGQSEM